jgi:hypothetical protein
MRALVSLCLMFCGCEALLTGNPRNCVQSPRACAADQVCNLETQSCEARSCRSSPLECLDDQLCDPGSKLCVAFNCVAQPSQCAADQRCNQVSRRCETLPFVLGQADLSANLGVARGMKSPQGVLLIPDASSPGQSRLVVADRGNRRVLIWSRVPTQNQPADAVLGMPDVNTISPDDAYGGVNEASLLAPATLSSDGTKLVVADVTANRVLFWNQIPTRMPGNGPIPANSLWGQSNFSGTQSDSPTGITNRLGVFAPGAYLADPQGRFFVADQFNHRILIFSIPPTTNTVLPGTLLGQASFDSGAASPTAGNTLREPRQVTVSQGELFVADSMNHRVLVFDSQAAVGMDSALSVLGQPTFGDGKANQGGALASASTLNIPTSVHVVEGTGRWLWVADTGNHRVLRYTLPTPTPGMLAADLVLGQPDFAQRSVPLGLPTAATLSGPTGVHSDGVRLVVSDTNQHRVLIWNRLPTVNQQPADVVLGQPDAASRLPNNPLSPQPLRFNQVSSVATDGTRLFVADTGNHRVLIWNRLPAQTASPPDVVLGQPDFLSGSANQGSSTPSSGSMDSPAAIAVDAGRLAVADSGNHRVLIWNSIPTQSGQAATSCIGQSSCMNRSFSTGQARLQSPGGVSMVAGRLFVVDSGNHRVVWLPVSAAMTNALFQGVLGQSSYAAKDANRGGLSAVSMNSPRQVLATPTQLAVADTGNHRVLLWNTWPTALGAPADRVLGQEDFTSSYPRATRSRLESPSALLLRAGALYVASSAQDRVLIWSQWPSRNGQPADAVLGQPDFTASLPNHPDLPAESRLNAPVGLAAAGNQLFIAELNNNRVIVRSPLP